VRLDFVKVVRLRRRNLLALLVSRDAGGHWSVPVFRRELGEARGRLEPGQCLRAFEHIEVDERELDDLASGHATFALTYEELIAGERLEAVQRPLGVEPIPLESPLSRLRTRPLSETVENWDELTETLAWHAETVDVFRRELGPELEAAGFA
jgi:hypothetical protein